MLVTDTDIRAEEERALQPSGKPGGGKNPAKIKTEGTNTSNQPAPADSVLWRSFAPSSKRLGPTRLAGRYQTRSNGHTCGELFEENLEPRPRGKIIAGRGVEFPSVSAVILLARRRTVSVVQCVQKAGFDVKKIKEKKNGRSAATLADPQGVGRPFYINCRRNHQISFSSLLSLLFSTTKWFPTFLLSQPQHSATFPPSATFWLGRARCQGQVVR